MARPKKGEEQVKDAGTLSISREEFVRTRDAVSYVYRSSLFVVLPYSHYIIAAGVSWILSCTISNKTSILLLLRRRV